MKSNIFLVLIFLLIGGGIWMFTNGNGFGDKTVSVNGKNISISSFLTTKEWNYHFKYEESSEIITASGKAEYRNDGTYIKFLNIEFFKEKNDEIHQEDSYLIIEGGLKIEGKWRISENGEYWIEEINIEDCHSKLKTNETDKQINLCSEYIENPMFLKKFGKVADNLRKFSFTQIESSVIAISGKQYDIDSNYILVLN